MTKSPLIAFEEARRRVVARARALGSEPVPLRDALGRVLAQRLVATTPLPGYDYSAMDGYAVATQDFQGSGPWALPVEGESRTGRAAAQLAAQRVQRIFTGAAIPAGADAVVMQEDVTRDGDRALFSERPEPNANIRHRGEDLEVGQVALERGTRLGPFQLSLIAALDLDRVEVAQRPRVAVLSTGDELRPPGSPSAPGTLPESNSITVVSLAQQAGAIVEFVSIVHDHQADMRQAIERACKSCDVLITIGGVSVGDHDVVRPALIDAGAQLDFWKVAIKPGKPLVWGHLGNTAILGLPGNPVSAQLGFALFGVPLLRAMQGEKNVFPRTHQGIVAEPILQKPGRRGFYRARLEAERLVPLPGQSSGAPTSMAWADVLIEIAEDSSGCAAGDTVDYLRLTEI